MWPGNIFNCGSLLSFALILKPKPFWHGKGVLMLNESSYNTTERNTSQTDWNSQERNSPTPTFADNTTSKSMHITQRSNSKGYHKDDQVKYHWIYSTWSTGKIFIQFPFMNLLLVISWTKSSWHEIRVLVLMYQVSNKTTNKQTETQMTAFPN